jgi:DNA-binding NtrC family response regulator
VAGARVLIVEDDPALSFLLVRSLEAVGHAPVAVSTAEAALVEEAKAPFDVAVTDLQLAGKMTGTELCIALHERDPELPVVIMTAHGSLETAVAALRASAWDFVVKPFAMEVLTLAIGRALKHRALTHEVRTLRAALSTPARRSDVVGHAPSLRTALDLVARVAATDVNVFISGESGTGKELIARALHDTSTRKNAPFVAINCAAVPEALIESQLFGHVRGAFTDARQDRKGLFVQADGGTVFLDEIGDLPLSLQPKLLRALQERRVLPVGADEEVAFDARVVAATHKDLERMIADGTFRDDLYYRLNVVEVRLPPLRERGSDVLMLAQHFLQTFAARMKKPVEGISAPAAQKLLEYDWPGNVRELMNCIERAVALTQTTHIVVADLPDRIQRHKSQTLVIDAAVDVLPLEDVEKRYILRVLDLAGGQRSKAAEMLGIDRKTLYRKLNAWGVEDSAKESSEGRPTR